MQQPCEKVVTVDHKMIHSIEAIQDEKVIYVTLDLAAKRIGIPKNLLYYYKKKLGIDFRKFPPNHRSFIAEHDIAKIVEMRSPVRTVLCEHIEKE